jgi:inorganic pyrophosphatase/exopolyphosphatase
MTSKIWCDFVKPLRFILARKAKIVKSCNISIFIKNIVRYRYGEKMNIITCTGQYVDIDAYGAIIGYCELLNLQGNQSRAVFPSPTNASVPNELKVSEYDDEWKFSDDDNFIVLDVSIPWLIEKYISIDKITELIDHHTGNEEYWRSKLGDKAQIERIGSVCTIIYERWAESGLIDKMTAGTVRLLMAGILDNTLNFGASITNERDEIAFKNLSNIANFAGNFTDYYFGLTDKVILTNIPDAVINDTKYMDFKTFGEVIMGQIALFETEEALAETSEIFNAMQSKFGEQFIVDVIDIKNGKTFFIVGSKDISNWVQKMIGAKIRSEKLLEADKLWLRKEILARDLDQ